MLLLLLPAMMVDITAMNENNDVLIHVQASV